MLLSLWCDVDPARENDSTGGDKDREGEGGGEEKEKRGFDDEPCSWPKILVPKGWLVGARVSSSFIIGNFERDPTESVKGSIFETSFGAKNNPWARFKVLARVSVIVATRDRNSFALAFLRGAAVTRISSIYVFFEGNAGGSNSFSFTFFSADTGTNLSTCFWTRIWTVSSVNFFFFAQLLICAIFWTFVLRVVHGKSQQTHRDILDRSDRDIASVVLFWGARPPSLLLLGPGSVGMCVGRVFTFRDATGFVKAKRPRSKSLREMSAWEVLVAFRPEGVANFEVDASSFSFLVVCTPGKT